MNRKLLRKYLVLFLATTTFISQSISLTKAEEIIPTITTEISKEIVNVENLKFDGTEAISVENSKYIQGKSSDIMSLDKGTVTVRYRLEEVDSPISSLFSISIPTSEQSYASVYIKPKEEKIGIEFKNLPNSKTVEFKLPNYVDINNKNWHTISYIFTGSKINFYIDCQKIGETNFSGMYSDLSWKGDYPTLTIGGLQRKYVSQNKIESFLWPLKGTVDLLEITDKVSSEEDIKKIHDVTTEKNNQNKSYIWEQNEDDIFYYRIPSLVKASNGNLVIAADARKKHYNDWGDIKTVVKTSNNDGETWSKSTTVVDTATQPYYTTETIGSASDTTSSMAIDPSLLATSNNEVYMLVDVMPESRGNWFNWGKNDKGYLSGAYNSQLGTGYITVDGTKCLKLFDKDNNEYYVRKENNQGVVYKITEKNEDGSVKAYQATNYTVSYGTADNNYSDYGDLYKDGISAGNIYLTNDSKDPAGQNGVPIHQENSKKGELRVLITNYLWLFKSTDGGTSWSAPTDITPSVKEEWMRFIGAGAGIGNEITKEDGSKRLIFPIYYTNKNGEGIGLQSSAIIYSDDNGLTWSRSESANDGRVVNGKVIHSQTASSTDYDISENQVIQLKSGTLLQFMRTTSADQKVRIAKSTDYGLTWKDEFIDSGLRDIGCQLSVITTEFHDKEYVIFTNPAGDGPSKSAARYRGVLRIGEVQADDSIKWLTSNVIEPGRFAYSSIIDLGNGNIGVAYEDQGHISYLTYNIAKLLEANHQDANCAIEEVKRIDGKEDLAIGDEILIQVKMNQKLIMTGTRELDIKIGNTSEKAKYVSGTGTDTFIFSYTVKTGNSGDLMVIGLSSDSITQNKYLWNLSVPVDAYNLGIIGEITSNRELNHIFNGDFSKNSHWVGKTYKASANKVDGDNYYGSIEKGTSDDYLVQFVDVEPGKSYKLTANVKVDSESDNVQGVFLAVKYALNQNFKQIELKKTNGWETYEIEFTPEEGRKQVVVGLIKYAENNNRSECSNVAVSIDDVFVTEDKISDIKVKWIDDFNGNTLDQNIWGYELGRIRGNEQQHYVNSEENVFVKDGNLTLKVTERPEKYKYTNPTTNNPRQIIYNSGSVRTIGQKEFLYGRIEMRAKLPKGKGAFPAFWTLGADFSLDGLIDGSQAYGWPSCGEIDIMEMIGGPTNERLEQGEKPAVKDGDQQSNKTAYGTPHFYWSKTSDPDKDGSYGLNYDKASGGHASFREDLSDDYHIFGINWTETKIEWYIDGEIYNVINFSDLNDEQMQAARSAFNRPQYIQLNLATGGNWAGDAGQYLSEDNTQFIIDWVKWSQDSEQEAAATRYYADMPIITSKLDNDNNITVIQGQNITDKDLLNYVELNDDSTNIEYELAYSIDDEFMFVNDGIGSNNTGQTKVSLIYSSTSKNGLVKELKDLKSGVYNIHYTAIPKDKNKIISGKVYPTTKLARKTLKLVVLPKELVGTSNNKLSSVILPDGWSWENEAVLLDVNKNTYSAVFSNPFNGSELRKTLLTIPVTVEKNNHKIENNILVETSLSQEISNNVSQETLTKVKTEVENLVEDILSGKRTTQIDENIQEQIKEAIKSNETVVSKIIISSQEKNNVSQSDINEIDSILEDDEKVYCYLDIKIEISIGNKVIGTVNNLSDNIELTINIPTDIQNKGEFYIGRVHNGKAEKLNTKRDGNTLTFTTDCFSTYALVYTENSFINIDSNIKNKNTTSKININTGDNLIISSYVLLALCSICGVIILKRKSVSIVSVKKSTRSN